MSRLLDPLWLACGRCAWGAAALVTLLVGCGDANVGVVAGRVLVDGAPAGSGSIAFFPLDGKSPTAGGAIEQGAFEVQVAPGKSRVEIRVSKVVGEKKIYDTPNSPVQQVLAEVLPPKYNDESELEIEVAAGRNERDFELSTK